MTSQYINRWARETPTKTAMIHNDTPVTYAVFARAIEATRQRLVAQSAPAEGVAAVLTGDIRSAWVLILAARALGLTTVMISDIRRLPELALRGLVCLVTPGDEPPPNDPALAGLVHLSVPASALQGADGLDAAAGFSDPPRIGDHILYTSGTTGRYKKVLVESAHQGSRDLDRLGISGFTPESVFHAMDFGLWTGIGFKSVSASWLAGGTSVIDQTDARYANFRRYAPTYTPDAARESAPDHRRLQPLTFPTAFDDDAAALRRQLGAAELGSARRRSHLDLVHRRVLRHRTRRAADDVRLPHRGRPRVADAAPSRARRDCRRRRR